MRLSQCSAPAFWTTSNSLADPLGMESRSPTLALILCSSKRVRIGGPKPGYSLFTMWPRETSGKSNPTLRFPSRFTKPAPAAPSKKRLPCFSPYRKNAKRPTPGHKTKPSVSRNGPHPKEKKTTQPKISSRPAPMGSPVFRSPIDSAFWTAATVSAAPGTSTNAHRHSRKPRKEPEFDQKSVQLETLPITQAPKTASCSLPFTRSFPPPLASPR